MGPRVMDRQCTQVNGGPGWHRQRAWRQLTGTRRTGAGAHQCSQMTEEEGELIEIVLGRCSRCPCSGEEATHQRQRTAAA
jgi:hypothetical protein